MKKVFIFALAALTFVACKNDKDNEPEVTTQEPVKEVSAGAAYFLNAVAFNGVFTECSTGMAIVADYKKNIRAQQADEEPPYPLVTWTPQDGTWPIDLTINYGPNPVIGRDGLEHSGVMQLHATGLFETPGSVLTPKFTDFHTYGTVVNGSQTITNKGANEAGNLVFEVKVQDGRLGEKPVFVYDELSMREMIEPGKFSITGTLKSTSQVDTIPGFEATANSEAPMVIAFGDLYPTAGVVHVTFDTPLEYALGSYFSEPMFQDLTAKVNNIEFTFLGLKSTGVYSARMDMDATVSMFTVSMDYHMAATFDLNKDGVIPESIQYEQPEQKQP
ncbi:MAG: hypothetical protein J6T80_03700 [Paludibacteraceae bacterium]|nr:hypothetical protein [Paludibacteraceae bacterium]